MIHLLHGLAPCYLFQKFELIEAYGNLVKIYSFKKKFAKLSFSSVSVDTCGLMPITENGIKYIKNECMYVVAFQFSFTRHIIVKPNPYKESSTIAEVLIEDFILNHGIMHTLLFGTGTEINAEINAEMGTCT